MSKRLFSKNLYWEGMRQSKAIGIAAVVLLTVIACLGPSFMALSAYLTEKNSGTAVSATAVNLSDIYGSMVLIMYLAVPVLLMYLFRFLNKRKSSDFYHGIPQTRICLWNSFFLAAMTWVIAAAIISTAAAILLSALFSRYMILNVSSVWPMLVNTLAGSWLIAGAVLIAMSLTGTAFSGLLMSGLIIFLPRLILTAGTMTVISLSSMFVEGEFLPLLNYEYNVPVSLILGIWRGLFGGGRGELLFYTGFWPALYTGVLGSLYLMLGIRLFDRRKSEAASRSAVSGKVQAIGRISFALLFCILPIVWITTDLSGAGDAENLPLIIILYIIALIAYFLFEWITTRKPKNMLKIFPGLGILAGINVIVVGVLLLVFRVESSFCPEADRIQSVSIVSQGYRRGDEDYFEMMSAKVQIEDREAICIVQDSLQNMIRDEKEGSRRYRSTCSYQMVIKIRSDKGDRSRRLYFTEEAYQRLRKILTEDRAYQDIFEKLPDPDKQVISIAFNGLSHMGEVQARKLYAVLREEVKTVDREQWWEVCMGNDNRDTIGNLILTVKDGARLYSLELSVNELLPETVKTAVYTYNESRKEDRASILTLLKTCAEQADRGEDIFGADKEGTAEAIECYVYWRNDREEYLRVQGENVKTFYEALLRSKSSGDCYLLVCLSKTDKTEDGIYEQQVYQYFFEIDSAEFPWRDLGADDIEE